jgi:hypothetical protein
MGALEARFDVLAARMRGARRSTLAWGTPGAALLALLATGPQGPVVGAGLLMGHMIAMRWSFLRPVKAHLRTRTRRLMATWVPRVTFLAVGTQVYVLGALPGLALITWPLAFAVLTLGVHAYLLRHLRQERDGAPVESWEKLVVGGVGCALILATVVAVALAWGAASLVLWIFTHPG